MSDVLIDQDTMGDIGDAIREKLGVSDTYLPASMPNAIRSISGGGEGGGSAKYTEKELWSGTLKTVNATASLSESIYNFDQIKILWTPYNGTDNIYHSFTTIPVSDVIINQIAQFLIAVDYANAQYTAYISCCFSDSYTLKINEVGNGTYTDIRILKIIGIKWETMQTALIYSEEEREVGVWTDGKPLYQKTYIFDINDLHSGSVTSSDIHGEFWIDNLNHDKIWLKEGFVANTAIDVGDTGIVSHPSNYPSSGTYLRSNIQVNSSVNNGYPFIYFQSTYNASALYDYRNDLLFIFTICYTKTTDTPGSGIWTTTGEYAVHYDGTEKVIGTWFGETLYERSYDLTLSSDFDASGGFLIDNDVSYIKMLVSAEGSGKSPEGYITNMGGLAGAQVWQYNVHRNPSNQLVLYSGQSSSAIAGGKAAITIRYTKTTS